MEAQKLVVIQRLDSTESGTIGRLSVDGEFLCFTVELPWRDNRVNVSCIKSGRYDLAQRESPKFGLRWHVIDVPSRTHVLIHAANYQSECRGCIFPATSLGHTAAPGRMQGYRGRESRLALDRFERALPAGVTHQISIRECSRYVY